MTTPKLRVLSLGAGVQSTTLALMSAAGELEPLDAAIFADTGWEPQAVYRHLAWLETVLPFPVIHTTRGKGGTIRTTYAPLARRDGSRYASLPFHVLNADGTHGMGMRQCTKEWKLEPIARARRTVMERHGVKATAGSVEQWVGISMDEVLRMKPAREKYVRNRWPLIDLGMSRRDCLRWMEARGHPRPPKSSCVGCPYHSNGYWRELRATEPEAWEQAIAFDREIRNGGPRGDLRGQNYLHRSCKPLSEVDLSTAEQNGQLTLGDDFNAECEGLCGV